MSDEEAKEEVGSPSAKMATAASAVSPIVDEPEEEQEEERKHVDVEAEIRALVAKAKGRLEGVSTVLDENGNRLKSLQKGFKDLRRQQAHVAREQVQAIGSLEHGLKPH